MRPRCLAVDRPYHPRVQRNSQSTAQSLGTYVPLLSEGGSGTWLQRRSFCSILGIDSPPFSEREGTFGPAELLICILSCTTVGLSVPLGVVRLVLQLALVRLDTGRFCEEEAMIGSDDDVVAVEVVDYVGGQEVDRLFQQRSLALYLEKLFRFAGLSSWLHTQGAWTLRLFPGTGGGRYFTLNIGGHEAAYSSLPRGSSHLPVHSLVVDKLLCDFPEVRDWLKHRDGGLEPASYKSGALSLWFSAPLEDAESLFALPGVRRALVAYWSEALIDLHERDAKSVYARYHDYNVVAALVSQIRNRPLYQSDMEHREG